MYVYYCIRTSDHTGFRASAIRNGGSNGDGCETIRILHSFSWFVYYEYTLTQPWVWLIASRYNYDNCGHPDTLVYIRTAIANFSRMDFTREEEGWPGRLARPIFFSMITFPRSSPYPKLRPLREDGSMYYTRIHQLSRAENSQKPLAPKCSFAWVSHAIKPENTFPIPIPSIPITGTVIRYLNVLSTNNSSRSYLVNFRSNFFRYSFLFT